MFARLRNWYSCWRTLCRAESRQDPKIIANLLRQSPELLDRVEDRFRHKLHNRFWWEALIHATGIVMSSSRDARGLIRELILHPGDAGSDPSARIPWDRLSPRQLLAFVTYLTNHFDARLLLRFFLQLHQSQLRSVEPTKSDRRYQLWFLAIARGRFVTKEDLLILLAYALELDRTPYRIARWLVEGLAEFDADNVVRVADLLRRHGGRTWAAILTARWLEIEDTLRAAHAIHSNAYNTSQQHAGGAILAAMGHCASSDSARVDFDKDEQQADDLRAKLHSRQEAAKHHNLLAAQYRGESVQTTADGEFGGFGQVTNHVLIEALTQSKKELDRLDALIEAALRNRVHHSVAFLLWTVLCDSQGHSVVVRQGAAWGLHAILQRGKLTGKTRGTILEAITFAVNDDQSADFRERRVLLHAAAGSGAVTMALRDGLNWMMDVLGTDYRNSNPVERESFDDLERIASFVVELLPRAAAFLSKHPLRLMTLDDQQHLLGKYVRNNCGLRHWTRYEPPINVGRVLSRFIECIDRSTPNSMGLYYGLFRHLALVLPVLYHEYLHHAGAEHNSEGGIINEANVLIREILFARSLIARLTAPDPTDESLAKELVDAVTRSRMQVEVVRWFTDFTNNANLAAINESIEATYGRVMSDHEARQRADFELARENVDIQLANHTLAWCPHVQWPELNRTHVPGAQWRTLLQERWQQQHTLTPAERDAILSEPLNAQRTMEWADAAGRSAIQALECFAGSLKATLPAWAKAAVRLIEFEPIEIQRIMAKGRNVDVRIEQHLHAARGLARLAQYMGNRVHDVKDLIEREFRANEVNLWLHINTTYAQLIHTSREQRDLALARDLVLRRDDFANQLCQIKGEFEAGLANPAPGPPGDPSAEDLPFARQHVSRWLEEDLSTLERAAGIAGQPPAPLGSENSLGCSRRIATEIELLRRWSGDSKSAGNIVDTGLAEELQRFEQRFAVVRAWSDSAAGIAETAESAPAVPALAATSERARIQPP